MVYESGCQKRGLKVEKNNNRKKQKNVQLTNKKSGMNLNTNQISRQDLVDNSIFDLLQTLNPTDKHLNYY